ncbi:hypothetical protein [Nevskia sp.]|uniref:hypothetical protein n=1 Tax=Nevskia sp. TaxID=1929292 RepID=UPI0026008526|nr:hypothetical protein [Nevskia sp.]
MRLSELQTIGASTLQVLLHQVRVPMLIVNGLEDAFFARPLGGNFLHNLYPKGPSAHRRTSAK